MKLRLRNFDAKRGRIGTGAVVNSRKSLIGVERGRGTLVGKLNCRLHKLLIFQK